MSWWFPPYSGSFGSQSSSGFSTRKSRRCSDWDGRDRGPNPSGMDWHGPLALAAVILQVAADKNGFANVGAVTRCLPSRRPCLLQPRPLACLAPRAVPLHCTRLLIAAPQAFEARSVAPGGWLCNRKLMADPGAVPATRGGSRILRHGPKSCSGPGLPNPKPFWRRPKPLAGPSSGWVSAANENVDPCGIIDEVPGAGPAGPGLVFRPRPALISDKSLSRSTAVFAPAGGALAPRRRFFAALWPPPPEPDRSRRNLAVRNSDHDPTLPNIFRRGLLPSIPCSPPRFLCAYPPKTRGHTGRGVTMG